MLRTRFYLCGLRLGGEGRGKVTLNPIRERRYTISIEIKDEKYLSGVWL